MDSTILGAGSWGTALAILLARNGQEIVLAGRDESEIASTKSLRENLRYLPGFRLPEEITVCLTEEADPKSELLIVAVPSSSVREALSAWVKSHGQPTGPILIASKGLEAASARLMTEVVAEELPEAKIGVIGGPNLAIEIVRKVPTAAVIAFEDAAVADSVRRLFQCSSFRAYISNDVIGVELAGALKNVLAIAAGMADGLGFGDNTKGALLARGLREMLLLGHALGAKPETFLGVAGIGDLFATAVSSLSRNYRVGKLIAEGKGLTEALSTVGQVAEGVPTAHATVSLARSRGVTMPIFEGIDAVIGGRMTAHHGVVGLMERDTPTEGILLNG